MAVPSNWPQLIRAAGGYYVPLSIFNDEPFIQPIIVEAQDLTGFTFSGGVRAAFERGSPFLASFTCTAPTIDENGHSYFSFSLAEAVVETLRMGIDPGSSETLFYNLKGTPPAGQKATFFAGEFKLMGA